MTFTRPHWNATMLQGNSKLLETLKKVMIFDALDDEERKCLMQRVLRHHFKAHELIFSAGEQCRGLHLIETGSVKIFGSSTSGREQILATQGPGGTLGELAVLDGGYYPASAITFTESELLLIRTEDLRLLVLQNPAVRVKLLELIASRVRPMISIVEQLSFSTVRQRLADLLLHLAETNGKAVGHEVEFILTSTHRDLAAQIGTVPELISRNLSSLQALGLIRIQGKKVIISKPQSLRLQTNS